MGKNRKFIPNQKTNKVVYIFDCYICIHKNKCDNSCYSRNYCGSFEKRAGIRKGFRRKRNGR